MKKKSLVGIVIVIILILACIIYGAHDLFFKNRKTNLVNKTALITIMENIKLGDSRAKVEEVFNRHKTKTLQLKKLESEWLITMPYEFGATDWILWIGFDRDRAKSLKIRLSDSKDMKPKESPSDKIMN